MILLMYLLNQKFLYFISKNFSVKLILINPYMVTPFSSHIWVGRVLSD